MTSRSEAALALAVMQPVLPLESAGKRPLGGLGLRHASRDPETVRGWWKQWPQANLAMRCDGLLVIDVDGAGGERSLDVLQRRLGELPATRAQQTGRGRHLLYTAMIELGNSTRMLGRPEGIDLRGGPRGYVVAPPSIHPSGHVYRWLDERPPAQLPLGWVKQLTRSIAGPARPVMPAHILGIGEETSYGRAALTAELERLRLAHEGERNDVLNLVVFRLAQLVAGDQLRLEMVERETTAIALGLGLNELEIRKTVRSAVDAGLQFPRFPRAHAHARKENDL
jgi:hypothetical protein